METPTTQPTTEAQTPTPEQAAPRSRQEILAEKLPEVIRALPRVEDKVTCMTWLGDTRYSQYRQTGNREYLRLAKNCYLAARNFHGRQN